MLSVTCRVLAEVKDVSLLILVLEDDEHILQLLRDILESEGYSVVGLRHPELILDVMAREQPDLLLVDIMLPRRSGIEVADQLWTNGFGDIPMIAMSASTTMLDLARQMPFFQEVVRKPFDVVALLADVDRVQRTFSPVQDSPSSDAPAPMKSTRDTLR